MYKTTVFAIGCFFLLSTAIVNAQDKAPAKYGKISPADFDLAAGNLDSAANAVIIADVGSSSFEGNSKGWFTLEFHHYKRIKIRNKNGFDAGTVVIPLYVSGNATEKVQGLKAVTYNLENGKVVETKLDDKSVFVEKASKNWIYDKFTLPALKEGSIIEYSYTQTSDFLFNLQPWAFQGEYPCIWSEYEVAMPNFFQYVTLGQGYLKYDINTSSSRNVTFKVTIPSQTGGRDEPYSFDDNVADHRWVVKNAPALKRESYTTTLNNYIQKIEFQLARYSFPNSFTQERMGNWQTVSKELLESDDFGADLGRNNGWLDDDMKNITKGATNPRQKAEKIYAYVRDNLTSTASSGLYTASPLKTVFKNRSGNVAEINLLLTAMLLHEKIKADPIILSTRANGFTHELYPLLSRFNYVISRVTLDSAVFFLDASERWIGFGRLPAKCYNGHARVISKELPVPVYFDADSMTEFKATLAILTNEEKGALTGRLQSMPGYFESSSIREKVQDKGEPEFLKSLQSAYPGEAHLSHLTIDSLKQPEMSVVLSYNINIPLDSGTDLIYFNPLMSEGYKENPFKAAERRYPVEMPYAMDETFTLNMDVPTGYVVDEMPRSAKVLFNENEGFFEYLIVHQGDGIQLRSRIKLKKANFTPEDYGTLRDFFGFVVKKQSEQIVFKKKKPNT
jgi:hypothetical protein